MQNSKFLGLAALVLGIGAALAFTEPKIAETSGNLDPEPFEYVGLEPLTLMRATDPDNYRPLDTATCNGQTKLCSIMAEPSTDPDIPIIDGDADLEQALADYVNSNGTTVDSDFIKEKD